MYHWLKQKNPINSKCIVPKLVGAWKRAKELGVSKVRKGATPQVSKHILENLPTFLEWVHSFGGLKPWHRANGAIVAGRRLPSFGSGPFWLKNWCWKCWMLSVRVSLKEKISIVYSSVFLFFEDVYIFVQRFSFDWWQLVYRLAPSSMEKVSRRLGWLLTQSQPSRKSVLLGCFRDGLNVFSKVFWGCDSHVCISTQRFDDFFRGRFITCGGLFGGLAKQLSGETLAKPWRLLTSIAVLRSFPANAEMFEPFFFSNGCTPQKFQTDAKNGHI